MNHIQKSFGTVLYLSLFIVAADFATAQSRPFSVSCPFEAQVVGFKETTQPVPEPDKYPNTPPIEEFELTLKIMSHTFVPLPNGATRSDGIKDMCYFLEGATISGTWYTPGQPYTTGVNFQPSVDKTKVLTKNSVIKGEVDSYDHVIINVALVSTGTPDKQVEKTKEPTPNPVVSNDQKEVKSKAGSNNFLVIGGIVFIVGFLILLGFLLKFYRKR